MNFEDDLAKDIAAAIDKTESPAQSPPGGDAPPASKETDKPSSADAESKSSAGERVRDESGRFTKVDESNATAEKKPEAGQLASSPAIPQAADRTEQKNLTPPPSNWKGAGKLEWGRLPQAIQKEISDEFTRISGIETEHQRLKSAIGERATVLAAQYGSTEAGLQNLFAISDFATKDAAGFVRWFMQQRGLNPQQLFGQSGQTGEQSSDPSNPYAQQFATLQSQLQQLQQQNEQLQQNFQQAQTAPLQAEIQSFASDPKFPYFNDVRLDRKSVV